jgi:hypothetical protein
MIFLSVGESPLPRASGNSAPKLNSASATTDTYRGEDDGKMHDLALSLDAAVNRHHAGRRDDAPLLLEQARPDHEVGDAGLVLDGDKHNAFGGTRPLPDQHKSGGRKPAAIAGLHGLGTGGDAPATQIGAQEGDGVTSQRQPDMAVVFDNLTAGCHWPQCHGRLADLGNGFLGAG